MTRSPTAKSPTASPHAAIVNGVVCALVTAYLVVLFARAIMSWFPIRPDTPYASLYRILLGRPGGSHALRIAERLGLDEAIVEDARARVAPERLRIEELLAYVVFIGIPPGAFDVGRIKHLRTEVGRQRCAPMDDAEARALDDRRPRGDESIPVAQLVRPPAPRCNRVEPP